MTNKLLKVFVCMLMLATSVNLDVIKAEQKQITGILAYGASSNGHDPKFAVDNAEDTYWESPASNSMQDYRRFLDFDLNGLYDVSKIEISNKEGAYYHYEIYASKDGVTYDKIAFKDNDELATSVADQYKVSVQARYIRVNMSYNSSKQAGNIEEFKVFGSLVSKDSIEKQDIQVENFQDSKWGKEWNKFETDQDYAEQKTIKEMHNLVERVLGTKYKDDFEFVLRDSKDGKDIFSVEDANNKVRISGNNGLSMASGFNYYLHHYAKVDYNPMFASNLDVPAVLPKVGKKVVKFTEYDYRYALNFCTYSYTMAFWGWDEYQEFLDWCAMNGVNLVLDIIGQEEVLRQTLLQYNYTTEEVKEYISGPAYYAWFYMQNLFSAGGPLPDSWFTQRVELGRMVHDRMQVFGIDPVIQGFGGQVPVDFQKKNPDSLAASSGGWPGYDRPFMIKTYLSEEEKAAGKKDYFQMVGDTFYEVQRNVFGDVSKYYAVDPFHEGGTIPLGLNIVDINRTVQEKMIENDSDAIWVMQQWQWGINDQKLSGLANKNQAIVLDLQSDLRSQASPMENQQVPWIWNMLHNFGGRMGMDGVPEVIATKITEDFKNNNYMRGIGITPEALENSPVVYDLLFDMTWEQEPINVRKWIENYVERRYGGIDADIKKAWNILLDTAYKYNGNYYQGASESVINAKPTAGKINSASSWGHSDINYDKKKFEEAAQIFVNSYDKYKDSEAFQYDFVDVMRQVLANAAQEYQPLMGQAYREKDVDLFKKMSTQFLEIIKAQDQLLSTSEGFLLGTWIADSRKMLNGMDDWTKDLFEYNARSLITIWGMEKNGSLNDYSNRQWAGLTGDYYYNRWNRWIENAIAELEGKPKPHNTNWFMYGLEWATRKSDQPGYAYASTADTSLDVKEIAQTVLDKYSVTNMDSFVGDVSADASMNIAKGKKAINVNGGQVIKEVTDGDTNSGWSANSNHATIEVDLGGKYAINKVGFSLQQIAAKFHTKYVIEVFDGLTWKEVARSDADQIDTTNEHNVDVMGTKVRYTFNSTNGENLSNIYELVVYGVAPKTFEYINLAPNSKATSSPAKNAPEDASALIDGKETAWVSRDGRKPAWVELNFDQAQYIDKMVMKFEKGQPRSMAFTVNAILKDGSQTQLYKRGAELKNTPQGDAIEIPVNKEIKGVRVDISDAWVPNSGGAWPLIAEIELLQKKKIEIPTINVAPTSTATSSQAKPKPEDANALIDGKETAWVSNNGQVPAWVKLDLPKETYVKQAVLKFEKGQSRSMAFTVTGVDAQGNTHELYKRGSELRNTPQGEVIAFDVNKNIKSIKVDITGAWVPNAGNAWPLIAEIELYATPENIAPDATLTSTNDELTSVLSKLNDTKTDAFVTFKENDQVTIAFDKVQDVNMMHMDVVQGQGALQYLVEYKTEKGQYKTLFDYRNNEFANDYTMVNDQSVLTDEIRITFLNAETKVNEISVYKANVSTELLKYISKLEQEIKKMKVGTTSGTYDQKEIDKAKAVLAEAKLAADQGLNSKEVAQWMTTLEDAMQTLYKDGFIHVEKQYLYGAIDDANVLKAALLKKDHQELATQLESIIKQATLVAKDKNATQQAVDAQEALLKEEMQKITNVLEAMEEYDVVLELVKQKLNSAIIGEFEGQYPKEAVDALNAAVEKAEKAIQEAKTDVEIRAITKALNEAKTTFDGKVIVIDKEDFNAIMNEIAALDESMFDQTNYQTLKALVEEAKQIDFSKISQASLNEMTQNLKEAKDALVILNRAELAEYISLIKDTKEELYTSDSFKVFNEALTKAKAIVEKVSVTQLELDQAKETLVAAYESLEMKKEDITLRGLSLSLADNIGVNYYFEFSDEVLADQGASITFTRENLTTLTFTMDEIKANAKVVDGKTLYRVSVPMAARQMSDVIDGKLVLSDEREITIKQMSVQHYAKTILANEEQTYSKEAIAAVKAMLNYGAAAQVKFNNKTDHLANEILSKEDQQVVVDDHVFDAFTASKDGAVEGINYYGTSVLLKSETSISHYFTLEEGHHIEDYTITLNGEQLVPVLKDGKYYVDITGINAKDLAQTFEVKVSNQQETMTLTFGVFSYANIVVNGNYSEDLKAVVRAMYPYYQAADAYAKSVKK